MIGTIAPPDMGGYSDAGATTKMPRYLEINAALCRLQDCVQRLANTVSELETPRPVDPEKEPGLLSSGREPSLEEVIGNTPDQIDGAISSIDMHCDRIRRIVFG